MPGTSGAAEATDTVSPSGIVEVGDHGVAVRGLSLTLRDWRNLPDWTEKEPGSVFRWGDAELPAHFLSHREARLDTRAGEPLRLRARAEFDIRLWSVAEGLPHDKIRCLKVARDGTLWLGTVGGLVRCQGDRFEVFHPTNTPALRTVGAVVRAMAEDEAGALWFAMEDGLVRFSDGRFEAMPGTTNLAGVQGIRSSRGGGLWLVGDQGFADWRRSEVPWRPVPGLSEVKCLYPDRRGFLWLGGVGGVVVWDPATERVVAKHLDRMSIDDEIRTNLVVRDLQLGRDGLMWMGSSAGTWRVAEGGSVPRSFEGSVGTDPGGPRNSRFTLDGGGRLWLGAESTEGQVEVLEWDGDVHWRTPVLRSDQVSDLEADGEGSIWVGSRHGLTRIVPRAFRTLALGNWIKSLGPFFGVAEGSDGAMIFAGDAMVGRWSGERVEILEVSGYGPLHRSLVAPGTGSVFRAVGRTGWSLDLDFARRPVAAPIGDLQTNGIPGGLYAVASGPDRVVYLGTGQGILREDHEQPGGWRSLEQVGRVSVRCLAFDREGRLWLAATGRGVGRVSATQVDWVPDSGRSGDVECLAPGTNGVMWVGAARGLARIRDMVFQPVTVEGRRTDNGWGGLLEDRRGDLWVNAAEGLVRVQREHLAALDRDARRPVPASLHGPSEGVRPHDGSSSAQSAMEDRDGRLWFVRSAGLVRVEPWLVPRQRGLPTPELIRIASDNGEWRMEGREITTRAVRSTHRLVLRFSARCESILEPLRLQHRLEGFDPDWRDTGPAREATYAGLSPGHYVFRVRARTRFTDWGGDGGGWRVRVVHPFWKTWTFAGLCAAGVAGMVALLVARWRERERLESARQRTAALAEERSRIARAMHDHLGPRIASLTLDRDSGDVSHSRAREALRELNDVIWEVDPDYDSLDGMADFVANFASRYLGSVGLELRLEIDPELPKVPIPSGLRREMAALFKEALRNAAQHARARRITVRVSGNQARLLLEVIDDGAGFSWPLSGSELVRIQAERALDGGTGGLFGFETRMRKLGGTCRIVSAPGRGTTIGFECPLGPCAGGMASDKVGV